MAADLEREKGAEQNLAHELNTSDRRIRNIGKDIREIKDTIHNTIATKPKTWAQVAVACVAGTAEIRLEMAKRE